MFNKFPTQTQTQTSRYAGASKVMVRVTVDCTSENRELAAKIDVEGGKTTTVAIDCAAYLQVTFCVNLCHLCTCLNALNSRQQLRVATALGAPFIAC
jgi:hypothetical protein